MPNFWRKYSVAPTSGKVIINFYVIIYIFNSIPKILKVYKLLNLHIFLHR